MKCPKCEYLSFEAGDRCRNCGYDFSLAAPAPPSVDLLPRLDLDQIIGEPAADLTLFGSESDEGAAITKLSPPRAPLGVRRATPEVPRARFQTPRPHERSLFESAPAGVRSRTKGERAVPAMPAGVPAGSVSRVAAALVDIALLCSLDGAVLYFTLRLCGLSGSEILQLPAIPLLTFFLMLNGGYFIAFTAVGGQSIGKMALGIKVVGDQDGRVPFGRASLRTLAYIVSALPLGAGFLPGVFGADRLALHDRLAHTRVVRPSSA